MCICFLQYPSEEANTSTSQMKRLRFREVSSLPKIIYLMSSEDRAWAQKSFTTILGSQFYGRCHEKYKNRWQGPQSFFFWTHTMCWKPPTGLIRNFPPVPNFLFALSLWCQWETEFYSDQVSNNVASSEECKFGFSAQASAGPASSCPSPFIMYRWLHPMLLLAR